MLEAWHVLAAVAVLSVGMMLGIHLFWEAMGWNDVKTPNKELADEEEKRRGPF